MANSGDGGATEDLVLKEPASHGNRAGTVLVIDDDRVMCEAVMQSYADSPVTVLTAHSGADGLSLCGRMRVDVVLLDRMLPDAEGHTLCEPILAANEQTKIIVITAHPSFETVLTAMRSGAYDYLSKPFELEELHLSIGRALKTIRLENVEQIQTYKAAKESERTVLVGTDAGLGEAVKLIHLAAGVDSPVLITGETGTGKNVAASVIHYMGPDKSAPFISINCSAIPETLMEAELFGYERGAFTGAVSAKKGIFEMADGGTLFLDEIGDIPLHLQSKLLSVIEEKKIRRLGSESARPVNVRVIASTSVAIEKALGDRFRSDLYFRLSVIRIHMPPLKERKGDIPQLCSYLLKEITGGTWVRVQEEELVKLMRYEWPGNVRELKNILERAFILQRGPVIRPSELLVPASRGTVPLTSLPRNTKTSSEIMTLADVEKDCIMSALQRLSHNYSRTARALGISLSTLKRKLNGYERK